MVSLSSVISLFIWVAPWLLPRGLAFFRSIRASGSNANLIRPVPPNVQRCLHILYFFVVVYLIRSLPYFSPPNIFWETKSRLGLPLNLLMSRVAALRGGQLPPLDISLKQKLESEPSDFRLLYAAYGPEVVTQCPFCQAAASNTYLYYALPSIVVPHLIHIFLLGIITSSFFSGPEGARWRVHATIVGVCLAAGEVILTVRNDWQNNATKRNLQDVDFFHWRMRVWRLLAFALVDGVLGWFLWLTSTNRWMAKPPPLSQQMQEATQFLHVARQKIGTLGRLRNAVYRDQELKAAAWRYWDSEPRIMEELEQEREVVDARRIALSRMDYDQVKARAELWVDQVWAALWPPPPASSHDQRAKVD